MAKKKKKVAKKKARRKAASARPGKKSGRKPARKAAKKAGKKTGKKKARRTVMYSSKGKKLYAVRDKSGQFKDIQQYSRAHAADLRAKSAAEVQAVAAAPAAEPEMANPASA